MSLPPENPMPDSSKSETSPSTSAPSQPSPVPPEQHAWVSEPASAASKAHSKAAVLILLVLVVVLAGLVFAAVKLAGPVVGDIEFPAMNADAVGDSSSPTERADDTAAPKLVEYLIGQDLDAGTYRLAEPFVGEDRWDGCSFGVYSDGEISNDGYLFSDVFTGGKGAVTLADGEFWSTYDCGEWERVDVDSLFRAPDDAAQSFGVGAWLVGEDIRPGTYEMVEQFTPEVEDDYCAYLVSDRWAGGAEEMYDSDFSTEAALFTVTLESGVMMNNDNCGEWVRTGD